MFTRKQYMANEVSFSDYYGQFTSPNQRKAIAETIGIERLKASNCAHYNDIPLKLWDAFFFRFDGDGTFYKVQQSGDVNAKSLSNAVCIAKEAARLYMKELEQAPC